MTDREKVIQAMVKARGQTASDIDPGYWGSLADAALSAMQGDDTLQPEPPALTRFRNIAAAETGDGRMFTLEDGKEIITYIDRLKAMQGDGWRERAMAALDKAYDTFSFYAANHAAKGTNEGHAKASANLEMANEMLAAMKPLPTPPLPAEGEGA